MRRRHRCTVRARSQKKKRFIYRLKLAWDNIISVFFTLKLNLLPTLPHYTLQHFVFIWWYAAILTARRYIEDNTGTEGLSLLQIKNLLFYWTSLRTFAPLLLSTQDEVILFFKRCLISVQRLTFHFFFLLSWLTLLKHNIFDYELDKCLFVQPVRLRNHNHHTFPLTKSWIRPVWEQWSMRTQTYLNNEKEKWPDGPTVFCHVPDNSRSGFLC